MRPLVSTTGQSRRDRIAHLLETFGNSVTTAKNSPKIVLNTSIIMRRVLPNEKNKELHLRLKSYNSRKTCSYRPSELPNLLQFFWISRKNYRSFSVLKSVCGNSIILHLIWIFLNYSCDDVLCSELVQAQRNSTSDLQTEIGRETNNRVLLASLSKKVPKVVLFLTRSSLIIVPNIFTANTCLKLFALPKIYA